MNTPDVARLARTLMNEHGLGHWTFQWDRAVKRLGRCSYASRTISLSKPLALRVGDDEIRDTILHEIAHGLVGPGHGHDRIWMAKAREIGARPERCVKLTAEQRVPKPWVGTCPTEGCPTHVERHRLVASTRNASCGKCSGGRYDDRYKLNWRQR